MTDNQHLCVRPRGLAQIRAGHVAVEAGGALICRSCGEFHGGSGCKACALVWPCPTYAALTAALTPTTDRTERPADAD